MTVVAWHEDTGVSGGTEIEKRPGVLAATEQLRTAGAGILVVARRDRLARDVLTAALVERLCERHGARIASADGTGNGNSPEAKLLRTMVDALAAYERALIRARTKAALAAKKARGERVGGVPYGYRVGPDKVTLEADPEEQVNVCRARDLRARGLRLRAIGRALLDEGWAPRRAKNWHVQVVGRMVAPMVGKQELGAPHGAEITTPRVFVRPVLGDRGRGSGRKSAEARLRSSCPRSR